MDKDCIQFFNGFHWACEGDDIFGHNTTTLLKCSLINKNAYFYVSNNNHDFGIGFGNFWKSQVLDNGDESAIWQHISKLDDDGYICLNDIHDELRYEDDFLQFVHRTQSTQALIACTFIEEFEENTTHLNTDTKSNTDTILDSIIHIWTSNNLFFTKHIQIEQSFIELLKPSPSLIKYENDCLKILHPEIISKVNAAL